MQGIEKILVGVDARSVFDGEELTLNAPNEHAIERAVWLAGLSGAELTLFAALYFAVVGYIAPPFYVRSRKKVRQKDIKKALPDALDLLVICVEAGLGLNQALLRVSQEIGHVSPLTASELALVNGEIRAGVPREEALRNLAERTGVDDVSSLVTVLIQTDRFGTSISRALRVHSDTMREKRRQRTEEAAAKTTIKLVFPLAICIFPAMFVVVSGPGLILIIRELGNMVLSASASSTSRARRSSARGSRSRTATGSVSVGSSAGRAPPRATASC